MSVTDLPDCAWCQAANTLTEIVGLDVRLCECSCCSKLTRVDDKNRGHRADGRVTRAEPPVRDLHRDQIIE